MIMPMTPSPTQFADAAGEWNSVASPARPVCTRLTHDIIARRAYDIYVMTGRIPDQCTQNWQQAEQSLRDQAARQAQQRSFEAIASHLLGVR
ncbi:MAG: DUF2934 domain-containing protein [Phycisphaerae bacterium]